MNSSQYSKLTLVVQFLVVLIVNAAATAQAAPMVDKYICRPMQHAKAARKANALRLVCTRVLKPRLLLSGQRATTPGARMQPR